MATRKPIIPAVMALLGCVFCWGVVPVILRQLTTAFNAWTANGIRYPIAAVCYWPVLYLAWRRGELSGDLLRRTIPPALFALLGQVFWGMAPYFLPASAIGFYVRFSMVVAMAAGMFLFHDERKLLRAPRFHVGLLLVLVGTIWFSLGEGVDARWGSLTGIVIMLLCATFFGCYGVSVRYYLSDVNPIVGFAVVSQLVSIGTLLGMAAWGDPARLGDMAPVEWVRVLVSTVLGISLGHIFMYTAVRTLGATISSAIQSLTPFVTAAIAFWVLGEVMSVGQWLAGTTLVIGATLLVLARATRPAIPATAAR